jgi:sigma-54 dependent transcriptional regulator, acetoin dehydrogenase operon transcriptional activator AcoR
MSGLVNSASDRVWPGAGMNGPAPGTPSHVIERSHSRSSSFGLDRQTEADYSLSPRYEVTSALEQNRFLFQHAEPVMETLYGQIVNTHSLVALTSSQGMLLHTLGDADFLEKASRVALMPGANWSEEHKGTNAVGTALAEEEALTVHGNEHFLTANQFLTCSCSPIFDPYGKVIGALDVSGDHRSFHQHTLALVRMSAQMIENHMFSDVFQRAVRVHFHARPEFLGTLVEGIAVFSPEGRFMSANRSAQFQLGMPRSALQAHTFSSLFGASLPMLLDASRRGVGQPQQVVLHNGVSVWAKVKFKAPPIWGFQSGGQPQEAAAGASGGSTHVGGPGAPSGQQPGQQRHASQQVESGPHEEAGTEPHQGLATGGRKPHFSALEYLDTGDPQVSMVIQKLIKVSGRDIPVMILGETGTGKDLLAKAIHADSARAGQAFVSVNCASIPDTLIESELFGYEEGAFTGARKKGAQGRILQAHGGTLFLDEIGDMPKHLQARLLRVLQERKVSPLGAGKEVDVDVVVICATHKNLKELIARGDFREDLYYRLNGLVVKLPALRERIDFDVVVRKMLTSLCEKGRSIGLSAEVMAMFKRYPWPGNLRQLHNLLRTAVVMVGCDGDIYPEHLPDDFLEELGATPVLPLAARAHQAADSSAPPSERAALGMAGHLAHATGSVQTAHNPPMVATDLEANLSSGISTDPRQKLQDVALAAMAQMLRLHNGNVSAAAKALGVSRNTIYRKKDLLPPDLLR